MRRWRVRLAVLGVGAAIAAASSPTLSAWTAATSNPAGTVSAVPDWVAPAVDRLVVQKSQGGVAGYVKPGGTYHVCAKIAADTGNPASGLGTVVTNVTTLTTGVVSQVMNLLGGGSPCAASDNRDSGALTASASAASGTISMQVKDNAQNARTETAPVVVDGDPPAAVDITTTNGGTLNKPDTGDAITFAFDEAIDPHSIISGWDGTGSRTITVTGSTSGGGNDRLAFSVPIAGGQLTIKNDYITGPITYANSTIEAVGSPARTQYRVTLGAMSDPANARARTSTAAMTWPTSSSLFDFAGNPLPATTFTEPAPADADF